MTQEDWFDLGYDVGYGVKKECLSIPEKYREDYEDGKQQASLEIQAEIEENERYFDYYTED